jgi:hypothetical protein
MMAGVRITVPGIGGQIEAKKARMAAAVAHSWNVVAAPPAKPQAMPLWKQPDEAKPRRASLGDLGKRLQTARLA